VDYLRRADIGKTAPIQDDNHGHLNNAVTMSPYRPIAYEQEVCCPGRQASSRHRVQGIVFSNHGGRQTDGGVSSLSMLSEIVDAVGDNLDIFYDSVVRCGADIAKALAFGAKMCLVGRPYVYGLASGGEAGVSHVVKALAGDLQLTLHLSGIQLVGQEHLNRELLVREDKL
jgi:isopentenyl diphosphate isomerase/L-lactate dehydrogenase-like FMN-dependent dehydrogenase